MYNIGIYTVLFLSALPVMLKRSRRSNGAWVCIALSRNMSIYLGDRHSTETLTDILDRYSFDVLNRDILYGWACSSPRDLSAAD